MVYQTGELESALLATFCGEPHWIIEHFPDNVKVFLVMPAKGVPEGEQIRMRENLVLYNPRR